jgi:uncharacterized protein YyaL (SSP411 family)
MPNRLSNETSPYLLQHANNPVHWYPWSPEALARAKLLDRPIFLSIGYAACHWCHVMERESFEDEATARILNERFVAIKVDREERPDLDQIYMGAVQAMTGSGGWPMSVFLTHSGAPFYGGTYFPDRPRHGMPSFSQVLDGVWRAWTEQRTDVVAAGSRLVDVLAEQARVTPDGSAPAPDEAYFGRVDAALAERLDPVNGSWGGAPKFPQSMTLEYLLRRVARGGPSGAGAAADDEAAPESSAAGEVIGPEAMVRFTLDKMADGGIRDQLGGGFHRYATDERWLVPHFEQMLYDNAQLARVYLHAWSVLGDDFYREVAIGALDYMARELTTDDGAFAASQDADTDGIEGLTFTWRAAEVREVLGDGAPAFTAAYGVTDDGNWEGVTILSRAWPAPGQPPRRDDPGLEERLAASRARLMARRSTRSQPARDDKALAAWNGLAIAAFAEAGRLLADDRYTSAAVRAAETIVGGLLADDGSLRRSWKDGRAVGQGVLEDYAHLADGLLALYEATFDERWFAIARSLMDRVLARFADPVGGFFDTADDHERLITRPRDPQDNAVPSGGGMAATVLLRLAAWTGEARYREAADRALSTVASYLERYPTGFGQWLIAATFAAAEVLEIALVGEPGAPAMIDLEAPATRERWRPFQVLASADPTDVDATVVPLLAGRVAIDDHPTAYVCRGFVCDLPVTDAAALRERLGPSAPVAR